MKATALMLRFPPLASTWISVGLQHTMCQPAHRILSATLDANVLPSSHFKGIGILYHV